MDGRRINYRQALAPSPCIHLTEEDDEPPPNSSRNSDNTTTSPSIEEPFPEQNKTGCPFLGIAFIFEAGSTDSPVHFPQAVKRFPVNFPIILQTLHASEHYLSRCMEKIVRFLEPGPYCLCPKPDLTEGLS